MNNKTNKVQDYLTKKRSAFHVSRFTKHAFTLIEVLIASSIFAVVMIITTAAVSQTANYQGKTKEMRATSDTIRRLADMLTQDIREAKGSGTVKIGGVDVLGGMLLFDSEPNGTGLRMDFLDYTKAPPADLDTVHWNTLVLANKSKNWLKVYVTMPKNGTNRVYHKSYDFSENVVLESLDILSDANIITTADLDILIDFSGYTPDNSPTRKIQPFVKFTVRAETKNYDTVSANARARSVISSTVTSRNYQ